jgi:hypothetical protein
MARARMLRALKTGVRSAPILGGLIGAIKPLANSSLQTPAI